MEHTIKQGLTARSIITMSPARKPLDLNTFKGRFAWRLMALREKAKLTAEKAAVQIGVSVNTIYAWESATNAPHPWTFPKIAKIYKVNKTKNLLPHE